MSVDEMITQDYLQEILEYRDGALYHKKSRGANKAGNRAGSDVKSGYRLISINDRTYKEHRIIFLLHHGYLPDYIDHINCVRNDNRIENLRPATVSQNQANFGAKTSSKSGVRGVHFNGYSWIAAIRHQGVGYNLGSFKTKELAEARYKAAALELFGEYAFKEAVND